MANALYPKWKEALIQASANSDLAGSGTTGVFVALVDTGAYTYNAAHQFYSDLGASIVGTDQEIGATKTYTNDPDRVAERIQAVVINGKSYDPFHPDLVEILEQAAPRPWSSRCPRYSASKPSSNAPSTS